AVVLVAVCTLAAAVPLRSPPRVGRKCWILGMVPNELPFLVAYYLAAATVLAGVQGDLDTTVGRISLLVAAVTAIALAFIVVRATQTDCAIREALRDSIRVLPAPRRLPIGSLLVAPIMSVPDDVERIADVSYGPGGKSNRLDLYRRKSQPPSG